MSRGRQYDGGDQTSAPAPRNGRGHGTEGELRRSGNLPPAADPLRRTEAHVAVVTTATPTSLDESRGRFTPAEFEELDRQLAEDERRAARLHAATLDAINAVNLFVGEVALSLEPEDPRRGTLLRIQYGLDDLWRESGGPEHVRAGASEGLSSGRARSDRPSGQAGIPIRARAAFPRCRHDRVRSIQARDRRPDRPRERDRRRRPLREACRAQHRVGLRDVDGTTTIIAVPRRGRAADASQWLACPPTLIAVPSEEGGE